MHIPDGYLSPATCGVLGAAMLPVWYKAVHHLKRHFEMDRIPKLAMAAVFSFLIMMFNVPVPDGTTAHAIGATLAAILFGPWAAVISISVALAIQALVFGDGGILAFGANTFNMAFLAPFVGYSAYCLLGGRSKVPGSVGQMVAGGIGAYLGILVAALATAVELGLQPLLFTAADGTPLYAPYGLKVAIVAMMIPHMTLIGFVEAIVTAGALRFAHQPKHEHPYGERTAP